MLLGSKLICWEIKKWTDKELAKTEEKNGKENETLLRISKG